MADHKLPDEMALVLLNAAVQPDGFAYPFPIVKRPQHGAKVRTVEELDRAAEGLIRRGYLKRTKTTDRRRIWRTVRGVGDVTLQITPKGRGAINW